MACPTTYTWKCFPNPSTFVPCRDNCIGIEDLYLRPEIHDLIVLFPEVMLKIDGFGSDTKVAFPVGTIFGTETVETYFMRPIGQLGKRISLFQGCGSGEMACK